MSDDTRVVELLLKWDRLRADGATASVEEVCADCPELAGGVRERIAALAAMDRLLDLDPAVTDEVGPLDTVDGHDSPADADPTPGRGVPPGQRYRPLRFHARGG